MARLTDSGKIKQSELDKFFSKYGDASALESVFTSSPTMQQAAANFATGRRAPGMAEEPIPGAPPTDLSKRLEPVPWLVSMAGEGPKHPQNPASLQTWMKKQAETEIQQAREQKAIVVLIGSNPKYFINRTPDSFANLKAAEAHLKLMIDTEVKVQGIKSKESITDKDRQVKIDAAKAKGSGFLLPGASTGTVTGGGKTASDVLSKFGI